MIRRPPRSTLFPTRRSSDLSRIHRLGGKMKKLCGLEALLFPLLFLVTAAAAQSYPSRPVSFEDRKSTRLNSSHVEISYAVFCLKKKTIRVAFSEVRKSTLLC